MTDRHDSPPMTRRELRERERSQARAGSDPSWQAPADTSGEDKVEPADQSPESTSSAVAQGDEANQRFEPKSATTASKQEVPSVVPSEAPVTSYADYRESPTSSRAQSEVDSAFAPTAQSPEVEQTPHDPTDEVEHTMTRRQLREFRAAQRLAGVGSEAVEPSTELLADEPLRAAGPGDPDAVDPTAEPASAEPEWRVHELPATEFLDQVPGTSEAEIEAVSAEVMEESGTSDELAAEDSDGSHTRSFHPPTGHWSIAAKQEEQPSFEDIIAGPADTSGSGLTGSTLVLSSIPTRDSAWSAMGKSGEALTTGSVELPAGLSSTGEHARFDTSALDRMFDEEEVRVDTAMVHAPDSEPVRASRAVSSLTPTGDLVAKTSKTSNRVPMALAISAGALAVGVAGLFVAGAIMGFF